MFEIIVVASANRKSIIEKYLYATGVPYKISVTPNYNFSSSFKPKVTGLVNNHIGAYRCSRGHQDALRLSTFDNVLIFEDDAEPNTSHWMDTIKHSVSYLKDVEMVSYHGRQMQPEHFKRAYPGYIKPVERDVWIVAALAYMINRKNIEELLSYEYDGTPWDILLYRSLSYCLLENSCFDHNRSEGSLIDV